jgi:hypothetical protein
MMSGPYLRIVTPETTIVTEQHRQPLRLGHIRPTLTLLVVPPAVSPATAQRILMTAGRQGNVDSIDELLMVTAEPSPATGDLPDAAAAERWETDGGPVDQRA